MRRSARAIVFKDNNLLVIKRNKFGKRYVVLPGGGVKLGETPEGALIREMQEETGLALDGTRLVFIESAGDPYGTQYVYLMNYVSGEPVLSPDSDEAAINKLGQNLYEPGWLSLAELPKADFLSERLKQAILLGVAKGFPAQAVEIT